MELHDVRLHKKAGLTGARSTDDQDILIPGIMEHIERTGIHSGDSIAVYPAWNLNDIMREKILSQSRELALALGTRGLVNIQ